MGESRKIFDSYIDSTSFFFFGFNKFFDHLLYKMYTGKNKSVLTCLSPLEFHNFPGKENAMKELRRQRLIVFRRRRWRGGCIFYMPASSLSEGTCRVQCPRLSKATLAFFFLSLSGHVSGHFILSY